MTFPCEAITVKVFLFCFFFQTLNVKQEEKVIQKLSVIEPGLLHKQMILELSILQKNSLFRQALPI